MLQFICLKLLLCCSKWLSFITRNLFGYTLHSGPVKDKLRARSNYEYSVHVGNVLFRAKKMELDNPIYSSFFLSHESYQHPNCLLDDDVTLFGCDQYRVFFVRNPPGYDVFNSRHSPFSFIAQYEAAIQVLSMPIEHFLHFSSHGVPQKPEMKILLLSNTGRCGSTLLAQMMEELPHTITISEPDCLTTAHPAILKERGIPFTSEELTPAMIRVLCKPVRTRRVDHILIKPRGSCIIQMDIVLKYCPYVHHYFMYRHPKKCLVSFLSMFYSMPSLVLKYFMRGVFLSYVFGVLPENSGHYRTAQQYRREFEADWDLGNIAINFWALIMRCYLDTKSRLKDPSIIFELTYETLMEDPIRAVNEVLHHCGSAPAEYVQKSFRALDKDSQQDSGLSMKNLKKYKKPLTERQLEITDEICKAYGLPLLKDYDTGKPLML